MVRIRLRSYGPSIPIIERAKTELTALRNRRILDTVHVMFISHTVYTYTITDFGDFAAIPKPVWSVSSFVHSDIPEFGLTSSHFQEYGGEE